MFAQTLAYGLFAARCNHHGPKGSFKRLGAASEIPKTNPFLRQLFETITGTALDEESFVGFVDDLAQLLADTDIAAVLADFGKRTARQDPVVHFYETFLAAYDPKLREARGVYYTPEPVVSYLVRSVNYLLKTRFGCPSGLADTATVEYEREEVNGGKPKKAKATSPRVLILDPACGTATFLYTVIDHIRAEFIRQENAGMWSGYVRNHLLPRIFGFELLMAPYAVAHFKLGMQLAGYDMPPAQRERWAYDFSGDERLGVYLTNTLEEAERKAETLFGPLRVISQEANAALKIKSELPILAVIGNPPYSGHSANRSWEMKEGKRVPTFIGHLIQDYYSVDGQPLGEKNPKWLQDDYVKFIRWGQWRIERTGAGILAFITNHGYLDNPTFRGMRRSLMNGFTEIYVLDLHGNSKKKERAPDGSLDENVFDIQQGVALGVFLKEPGKAGPAKVYHADLWGTRETKYKRLFETDVNTTIWGQLEPRYPFYLFLPQHSELLPEYEKGWRIPEVFPVNASTVTTARNDFSMAYDPATLKQRIGDLKNATIADEALRERYGLKDVSYWSLKQARLELTHVSDVDLFMRAYCYRPFDFRFVFYHHAVCERLRSEVMGHMKGNNVAFLTHRPQSPGDFTFAYCTRMIGDQCVAANKTTGGGNSFQFPLFIYPDSEHQKTGQSELDVEMSHWPAGTDGRRPNLNPEFVADFEKQLGLSFVSDGKGDLEKTFGPEDVFNYIYAVFHSPTYRTRYAEFLKSDFPRVPLTSDAKQFGVLCGLGAELVALHLLESPKLAKPIARYPVTGPNIVEKGFPKYLAPGEPEPGKGTPLPAGRVYISKPEPPSGAKGQYFEGVPPEVWNFQIGGYQVCEKWLKDRRGRTLTYDDLEHYRKIITALSETIRLMAEIDAAIPQWPIK
jgi:predicted helicase